MLPCSSIERSVDVIRESWAPRFMDVEVDEGMMDYFIKTYGADLSKVNFISREDHMEQVKHHKWSSPGPDGIHYAFWAMHSLGKSMLWDVRMAIRNNAKVPEGFNWALLVLIEKDAETYTGKGLPTPSEELRPISLGNTDAKTYLL